MQMQRSWPGENLLLLLLTLPSQEQRLVHRFPVVVIRLRCEIHGWELTVEELRLMMLKRRDRDEWRNEMVGALSTRRMKEMRRNRRASEEMIRLADDVSSAASAGLHPLEVKPVLLKMASDVLSGQPVDAHELHDGFGNRVLDPEVRHRVHEALVQLRRPHQTRPF